MKEGKGVTFKLKVMYAIVFGTLRAPVGSKYITEEFRQFFSRKYQDVFFILESLAFHSVDFKKLLIHNLDGQYMIQYDTIWILKLLKLITN